MVDVTDANFEEIFPSFEHQLKKCSFLALDCEFTSLPLGDELRTSIQDSGSDRYQKTRQNINQCFPLQVGLVPFTYDRNLTEYGATIYTFNIFPKFFGPFDNSFIFRTSSIQFLRTYNFDFNKVFYSGIPFLNQSQAEFVAGLLEKGALADTISKVMTFDEQELVAAHYEAVNKWLHRNPVGESVTLDTGINAPHVKYFLHKEIRRAFKNAWTFQNGMSSSEITVKHVSEEERNQQCTSDSDLDQELLTSLRGFSRVIDALIRYKKPIVGHNLLIDLLSCYHFYYNPLPKDYKVFKSQFNQVIPTVFDTKFISYEINRKKAFKVVLDTISLQNLFKTFQNAKDQQFKPRVKLESGAYEDTDVQQLHSAGWDAYITGFCFLKMLHLLNSEGKSNIPNFANAELLASAAQFKNKLNVPRAFISYICLDGPDPVSTRPPHLVVSHSSRLNLKCIDDLLSGCGNFEIKPMSPYRVTIVPPNYSSYHDIWKKLSKLQEFKVEKYSLFRHNKWVRSICFLGFVMPTGLTIWYYLSK